MFTNYDIAVLIEESTIAEVDSPVTMRSLPFFMDNLVTS